MAVKTFFECHNCGYQSPKWFGKCPDCNQWNSLIEGHLATDTVSQKKRIVGDIVASSITPQRLSDVKYEDVLRRPTCIGEFDRVLGGGLVKGSAVLIGGEPGIGKSTLVLQVSNIISKDGKVLYVSGEESLSQIKLCAERLKVDSANLYLINETRLEQILDYIKNLKPYLVIIDSIQVIYSSLFSQGAGTVTQIKECACTLTSLAKSFGISIFIIGHITKEGFIAGPKVLEHIVDSVIYFEGESGSPYRILRAVKNRFGPTDEIGVFSMDSTGLKEIKDPSGIFISKTGQRLPGVTVTAAIEGSRPLLLEMQALASRSDFNMPRQRAMGFDFNRMALLIAVLEKHVGLALSNYDLFLNITGGIKVNETASDLAACIAICSSFKEKPVIHDSVIIGEVGLTAEVRAVSGIKARINEAQRNGFKRCIIPTQMAAEDLRGVSQVELIQVDNLKDALNYALA